MSETLLPDNATAQEIALDLATSRIGDVAVDIRAVMNPQACPAHLLPWLAWALSVDEWDAEWTEETKRAAVAASVGVHRRKGTRAAVRAAIAAAGYGDADLVERFGYNFYDGARRHNGGNDNYAAGAADVANSEAWPASLSSNGVTWTKTGSGIDPVTGEPWVEGTVVGTAAGSRSEIYIFPFSRTRRPCVINDVFVTSFFAQIVGGAPPENSQSGIVAQTLGETAPSTYREGGFSGILRPTTRTLVSASRQMSNALTNQVRSDILIRHEVGVAVNYTIRISGYQFELGPARTEITPYDFNYGVPDYWAEYRLNLARPITIAQAAQVRRIAEGVAPLRSRLKLLTYTAAQHLYDGTIQNDGTFAHGAA